MCTFFFFFLKKPSCISDVGPWLGGGIILSCELFPAGFLRFSWAHLETQLWVVCWAGVFSALKVSERPDLPSEIASEGAGPLLPQGIKPAAFWSISPGGFQLRVDLCTSGVTLGTGSWPLCRVLPGLCCLRVLGGSGRSAARTACCR